MKTHESYCSFETAKLLKQAGFDWEVRAHYCEKETSALLYDGYPSAKWNSELYDGCLSAPTQAVAHKWIREVKHCFVNVNIDVDDNECEYTIVVEPFTCKYIIEGFPYCNNSPGDDYIRNTHGDREYFNTYEQALEAGVNKCLTILLEEKK